MHTDTQDYISIDFNIITYTYWCILRHECNLIIYPERKGKTKSVGCFSGANRINASDFRKLTFAKKKEGQFVDDFLSMNSVFLLVLFWVPLQNKKMWPKLSRKSFLYRFQKGSWIDECQKGIPTDSLIHRFQDMSGVHREYDRVFFMVSLMACRKLMSCFFSHKTRSSTTNKCGLGSLVGYLKEANNPIMDKRYTV